MDSPRIGLVMGSNSDWSVMEAGARMLDKLAIPYEAKVVSAHRTPDRLFEYAETARQRALACIIAGAGGARLHHRKRQCRLNGLQFDGAIAVQRSGQERDRQGRRHAQPVR